MVLKNQRHERFAQELAAGERASEAYVRAGYRLNYGNCIRLKGNERIKARVAELQALGAFRAEVTITSLLQELEHARQLAIKNGQAAAAVAASMAKAKLTGLPADGDHVGQQIIIAITPDEAKL
jgi:hypothetical protein